MWHPRRCHPWRSVQNDTDGGRSQRAANTAHRLRLCMHINRDNRGSPGAAYRAGVEPRWGGRSERPRERPGRDRATQPIEHLDTGRERERERGGERVTQRETERVLEEGVCYPPGRGPACKWSAFIVSKERPYEYVKWRMKQNGEKGERRP